ncbi:MAG: hypothetical protein KKA10_16310 [Euryarchaeota archaeon]|nr:hypothetical protein [Euryarchaeota archaeon]MCG2735655.1 hypothetical protein [Candidatus Methanoperedenaceae archaeon]
MTRSTKSALSAHKNTSQNPGLNMNIAASRSSGLSEVDVLLSELLPHVSDLTSSTIQTDSAVPYNQFRKVILENGIKAVRLPDGRHIARALDRKTGSTFWTFVRD